MMVVLLLQMRMMLRMKMVVEEEEEEVGRVSLHASVMTDMLSLYADLVACSD
jgi:hypothetical protein